MTWHADDHLLAAYADGLLGRSQSSSVEAHLMACAQCRSTLRPMDDVERLDRNLAAILSLVDQPVRRWPERLMARCGVGDRVARLVSLVPGARDPWLGAVIVVLAMSLAFSVLAGSPRDVYLFLVAAPLLPVAAVAAVFATRDDPAREVVLATPAGGLELLLARWAAVVVPAISITAVSAVALPDIGWTAASWLLPSVCMAMVTMALASWLPVRAVAAGVAGLWVVTAALHARRTAPAALAERFAAFTAAGQVALAVGAAVAGVVLVLRRDRFELGDVMGGLT